MVKNHATREEIKPRHIIFIIDIIKTVMRSEKAFNKILAVVGARLAALRLKKGYSTIKEFVERYDLPEIQYWRIEKGKANVTLKSLTRILSIHKLTLHEFFCMIEEDQPVV